MIKILHLQTELNLACGVTRTISQIIKNSSLEFEHHLIALGGNGLTRFEVFNFNPIVINFGRFSLIGAIKIYFYLLNYCKKHLIQIIHSHHRYFDTLVWLLRIFLKVKTITSVQSKVHGKNIISYKADLLIACGNSVKTHLINEFKIDKRRIKVIYNSVDPKEVVITKTETELLNLLDIASKKFIVGYFGRLDFKEKGVDILLEAFLKLSELNKDLFLLLIGNGVDENKIREFLIQNKIRAKMMNSQEDIFNYFQLLDVFVLPSRVDPFPLSMLESGIFKVPFIGSNVDGIAELVENEKDGLLVESGNAVDLKNQILRIYNNQNLANTLTQNLNKKVLEFYNVDRIIPQYEKLYTELLVE